MTYTLQQFIKDLTDITGRYQEQEKIVAVAKPLLAELVKNPACIEPQFKRHGGKTYGRYMLHRARLFNVTSVSVWGPGDGAKAHNHDTWGLVGVVDNELQETRFKRRDDGSKAGYAELVPTGVNSNKAGTVSTLSRAGRRHPPDAQHHAKKYCGGSCLRQGPGRHPTSAIRALVVARSNFSPAPRSTTIVETLHSVGVVRPTDLRLRRVDHYG